jgi:putative transcriptional regulator
MISTHQLGPGMVLVAMPMLDDPQFARSVVYLLESDPDAGSAGVVVTAPTRTPVAQVLPSWHAVMSDPALVFRGGPVQPDGALGLAEVARGRASVPIPGIRTVRPFGGLNRVDDGDCVGVVDLDGDIDRIASASNRLRLFAGHAGWSSGQLEAEIAEGAWVVVPGRPDDVFADNPNRRWREVLRRQPYPLRMLASYPADPAQN